MIQETGIIKRSADDFRSELIELCFNDNYQLSHSYEFQTTEWNMC